MTWHRRRLHPARPRKGRTPFRSGAPRVTAKRPLVRDMRDRSSPTVLRRRTLAHAEQRPDPRPPCATPEHRQFDFWLGTWDVHTPDGKRAGANTIRLTLGGCVLQENWQGAGGHSGTSYNIYDAPRQRWHQTWVDDEGQLLQLDGTYVDGKMVLVRGDGRLDRARNQAAHHLAADGRGQGAPALGFVVRRRAVASGVRRDLQSGQTLSSSIAPSIAPSAEVVCLPDRRASDGNRHLGTGTGAGVGRQTPYPRRSGARGSHGGRSPGVPRRAGDPGVRHLERAQRRAVLPVEGGDSAFRRTVRPAPRPTWPAGRTMRRSSSGGAARFATARWHAASFCTTGTS